MYKFDCYSGGNIKNFHCLIQQFANRANKKTIQENAAKHNRRDKRAAEEALFPIIAHSDGKIIKDITNGKKAKRDVCCLSQY